MVFASLDDEKEKAVEKKNWMKISFQMMTYLLPLKKKRKKK
ncbi:hypothetical protein ACLRE7_01615 [Mycoplasmopsis meleagridis]